MLPRSAATLRSATLRSAPLRYATLRYASLRFATLRYASLRYAPLRFAPLRADVWEDTPGNSQETLEDSAGETKRNSRMLHGNDDDTQRACFFDYFVAIAAVLARSGGYRPLAHSAC